MAPKFTTDNNHGIEVPGLAKKKHKNNWFQKKKKHVSDPLNKVTKQQPYSEYNFVQHIQ